MLRTYVPSKNPSGYYGTPPKPFVEDRLHYHEDYSRKCAFCQEQMRRNDLAIITHEVIGTRPEEKDEWDSKRKKYIKVTVQVPRYRKKIYHRACYFESKGERDWYRPGILAEMPDQYINWKLLERPPGQTELAAIKPFPKEMKFKPVVELPPEPEKKSWWRRLMGRNPLMKYPDQSWYFMVGSDKYGSDEYGPYDSYEEALDGLTRVKAQSLIINDKYARDSWGPYPESERNPFRRKSMRRNPGFSHNRDPQLAEELYHVCNESGCDEVGDVQELGWHGLITDYKGRHFIVEEDNYGFFTYQEFKTAEAARKDFQKRQVEYDLLESGRAYAEGEYPESEENPQRRRRAMKKYNPTATPKQRPVSSGGTTYVTVQSSSPSAPASPQGGGSSIWSLIIWAAVIGGLGFATYWIVFKHKYQVGDVLVYNQDTSITYTVSEIKLTGLTQNYVLTPSNGGASVTYPVKTIDNNTVWVKQ